MLSYNEIRNACEKLFGEIELEDIKGVNIFFRSLTKNEEYKVVETYGTIFKREIGSNKPFLHIAGNVK